MKKVVISLIVLIIAFLAYWKFLRQDEPSGPPPKPLEISSNSAVFTDTFQVFLKAYYNLKDAFIESDTNKINTASSLLNTQINTLNLNQVKADSTLIKTAISLKESIKAEVEALIKENDIEEKRKSFQTISDALYNLIVTIKYDKEQVYQFHCPMAFNDAGADWLSNTKEVRNPYFGNKMLKCGAMVDSIDYRALKK